jgi:hypothetical protein
MTTVFMPLLNAGVDVWRPVDATPVGDNRYCVGGSVPDGVEWAFDPGSTVICELKVFSGGEKRLTAVRESKRPRSTHSGHCIS